MVTMIDGLTDPIVRGMGYGITIIIAPTLVQ
jgi:hypothetical protein